MKQNLGNIDRILRVIAGLVLIGWGLWSQNWLGAIGLVALFTAAVGWCPAYLPFGLSSCRIAKQA